MHLFTKSCIVAWGLLFWLRQSVVARQASYQYQRPFFSLLARTPVIAGTLILHHATRKPPPTRVVFFVAGAKWFEHPNDGVRVRCLTAWRRPNMYFLRKRPSTLTCVILSNFLFFGKRFYAHFESFFKIREKKLFFPFFCTPKACIVERKKI